MLLVISHGRKIVHFGCALVENGKEFSFIWVLEQLVEFGERQNPRLLWKKKLKKMAKAIKAIFLKT